MARVMWSMVAVILGLGGWDLLARGFLGDFGWVVVGVGLGVAIGVVGSLAHDVLAGSRERL